jgi:hypothetical protein
MGAPFRKDLINLLIEGPRMIPIYDSYIVCSGSRNHSANFRQN